MVISLLFTRLRRLLAQVLCIVQQSSDHLLWHVQFFRLELLILDKSSRANSQLLIRHNQRVDGEALHLSLLAGVNGGDDAGRFAIVGWLEGHIQGLAGKLDDSWAVESVVLGKLPGEDCLDSRTISIVIFEGIKGSLPFADCHNVGEVARLSGVDQGLKARDSDLG